MQANATHLKNDRQATVDQVRAFIKLMTEHGPRILDAKMLNGIMVVIYETKSGCFYTQKFYDQYGRELDRKYFKGWDAEAGEPVEPVNFFE